MCIRDSICAVILYDAKLSQSFAAQMLDEGIYVTGFYYPVVPQGQARIRVQLSAAQDVYKRQRESYARAGAGNPSST